MDYCMCISLAMSFRLVSMLLLWLVMQCNGSVSKFFNTFLIFWTGFI